MSSTLNNNDTKSQKSLDRSSTRNTSGVNVYGTSKFKKSLSRDLNKKTVNNKDKKENKNATVVSSSET